MDALLKLVFDNFFLLFAFAVLWNIVAVAFMLWRRKQRGLVLPKVGDPDVIFSERFASGSSNKSWMTRMGGASNCLTVIVTKTHIAITTFFPFTAFAGTYDLEHLIPISDITAMTPRGRITDVEFQRSDGTRRKISLRLRKTDDFLRALRGKTNSEQDATSNGG
jgi:hypothetical protein